MVQSKKIAFSIEETQFFRGRTQGVTFAISRQQVSHGGPDTTLWTLCIEPLCFAWKRNTMVSIPTSPWTYWLCFYKSYSSRGQLSWCIAGQLSSRIADDTIEVAKQVYRAKHSKFSLDISVLVRSSHGAAENST